MEKNTDGLGRSFDQFPVEPVRDPDEVAIPTLTGDAYVVVESAEANPNGTSYVRVVDMKGRERLYWESTEWADDPELVMGAIFGVLFNGLDTSRSGR
jgi:hypothetical protein